MEHAGPSRLQSCIALAAREARLSRGVQLVFIAAAAGMSEAAVGRFERSVTWPRAIDSVVEAYESELGMERGAILLRAAECWRGE